MSLIGIEGTCQRHRLEVKQTQGDAQGRDFVLVMLSRFALIQAAIWPE
jgi:hypothetical protein